MKILLLYPSFKNVGGVHNVIIDLYLGLKNKYDIIISSYDSYKEINDIYKKVILKSDYRQLSLFNLLFEKAIIMSHHRKLTTKLLLLSLFQKNNIIHVAHNEYFNLKHFTLYPKNIIAVSDRVKNNLITYFKQRPSNIIVIKNGIHDKYINSIEMVNINNNEINILYPARITNIKNQVNIVCALKNKLNKNIKINFAGDGPSYSELVNVCKNDVNFKPLGFISDIFLFYEKTDYVLLFTKKEGLPISLIEAIMMGKPIICNDVGGNLEIVENKVNGFVCNTFQELLQCINNLSNIPEAEYSQLSENARDKYLNEFQVDTMIKQYKKYILHFTKF